MKQKEEVQQAEINLLLHITGGLGKCIMATAVIRSYKKANPISKIVVVSGYPEVFINNPDIYRNLPFNTPYLWQDFYGKPGWIVQAQDPYLTDAWIKNRKEISFEAIVSESKRASPATSRKGPNPSKVQPRAR